MSISRKKIARVLSPQVNLCEQKEMASSVVLVNEPQHVLVDLNEMAKNAYKNLENPAVTGACNQIYVVDQVFSEHPQLLKTLMACEETLLELGATDTCSGIIYVMTLKVG